MGEPLSTTTSIIAVLQLTVTVINYLRGVKDASQDCKRLIGEVSAIRGLLTTLNETVDDAETSEEEWSSTIRLLAEQDSPLHQLKTALQELALRLEGAGAAKGLKKLSSSLQWPFKQGEVDKILKVIERQKSSLNLALANDHIALSQAIRDDTKAIRAEVSATKATVDAGFKVLEQERTNTAQDRILHWLTQVDPSLNHLAARKKHESGTGQWFIQGPEFKAWKESPNSLLWLHGKPGSGKTILSSSAIQDIEQENATKPKSAMAYFYFSFTDAQKQSFSNFLCSIIAQLCRQTSIPRLLEDLYSKHQPARPPSAALEAVLDFVLTDSKDAYIIMDALDECPKETDKQEREDVLQWVKTICSSSFDSLHLMITSRMQLDIEDALVPLLRQVPISIEASLIGEDIRKYVDSQIANDRRLKTLDDASKEFIRSKLVSGADGMFRWVFCQMEDLKKLKFMRARDVAATLNHLPKTLYETYDRILMAVDDRYYRDAFTVLQWLAFSARPLTLTELAETCIIDPRAEEQVDEENRFQARDILELLPGLITESFRTTEPWRSPLPKPSISEVRLAHFSVKEYLVSEHIRNGRASKYGLEETAAHKSIVEKCVAYIVHYSASEKTYSSTDLVRFPLLEYCSSEWYHHIGAIQSEEREVVEETVVVRLFTSRSIFEDWLQVHLPDTPWRVPFEHRIERDLDESPGSMLYHASFLGLDTIADRLLNRGAEFNAQGRFYITALQAASGQGHEKVVELLLNRGAEVNAQGGYYGTALQAASARGHEKVVELLLNRGAEVNVNAQGGRYDTALQAASGEGHEKVVEQLLNRGPEVNVNAQGGFYGTALQAASARGDEKVVELLLNRGAEVNANAQGKFYGTALQAASGQGQEKFVEPLFNWGAEVNAQGGEYGTALQAASARGHEKVVELLLNRGAEVNANAQGKFYGTALQAASGEGQEKVVELLLNRGAEVNANAQGGYYGTALQAASGQGQEKFVELLLNWGAEVNAQGGYYGTALQAASARGHEKVVELLLNRGAEVHAQGGYYGTALQAASREGHEKVVELLLGNRAKINAQGGCYGNALNAAAFSDKIAIMRLLGRHLIDWNAGDNQGRTALHIAARGGHLGAVNYLLDLGLNPETKDKKGDMSIHYAASGASAEVVRKLLDGQQLAFLQSITWTPLHWACRTGDFELVRLLLLNGANPKSVVATTDPPGQWTPLSIASFHQNRQLVSHEGQIIHKVIALQENQHNLQGSEVNTSLLGEEEESPKLVQVKKHGGYWCNGCLHYIYGPRFRCQSCLDFDYCFMCKLTSDLTHPGHTWDRTEPDKVA
ncbi:MAG: hypothetical protein M1816_002957 [Peltula sp. TS41687]|nr:MAG: hypothetical protein M1816_002957 [Peltula sp. TS41687]